MWYSTTKVRKITGKIDLRFCKLTFLEGKKPNYIHIFLNASEITRSSRPQCYVKKVFLEISQNSQEKTPVPESLF